MLQVKIEHANDSGEMVTITEIKDDEKILATFFDGLIDVDVCIPYIGKHIVVNHSFLNKKESYDVVALLESVDIDGNSGVKYIKYSPKKTTR